MERTTDESRRRPISTRAVSALQSIVSKITVEPIAFVCHLSTGMTNVVTQNLFQERICEQFYHGTKENCSDYVRAFNGTNTVNDIQRDASDYTMYTTFVRTLPAVLMVLLLAPWSDRHGRTLVIMLPVLGFAISSVCNAIVANVDSATPLDILLSMVPSGIGGGDTLLQASCYSYLGDVTDDKERTPRMAFFEGAMIVGTPIGTLIGGQLFVRFGYTSVYVTSAVLNTVLLVYTALRIKNVRPATAIENTDSEKPTMMSYLKSIPDNARVCFKKRAAFLRAFILLVFLVEFAYQFPLTGEDELLYLYTQRTYQWDVAMFSYYKAFLIVLGSAGLFVLMPILSQTCGIDDSVLGLLCSSSKLAESIMKTFSYTPAMLWIAGCGEFVAKFALVVDRAILSKCVSPTELGKVFAFDAILITAASMIANTLYTQVYKQSVSTFPGSIFLITVAVIVPTLFAYTFIYYRTKKQPTAEITTG